MLLVSSAVSLTGIKHPKLNGCHYMQQKVQKLPQNVLSGYKGHKASVMRERSASSPVFSSSCHVFGQSVMLTAYWGWVSSRDHSQPQWDLFQTIMCDSGSSLSHY